MELPYDFNIQGILQGHLDQALPRAELKDVKERFVAGVWRKNELISIH